MVVDKDKALQCLHNPRLAQYGGPPWRFGDEICPHLNETTYKREENDCNCRCSAYYEIQQNFHHLSSEKVKISDPSDQFIDYYYYEE